MESLRYNELIAKYTENRVSNIHPRPLNEDPMLITRRKSMTFLG